MSWQLFTAISVAGLSISIILQRLLLYKDKLNPFAYAVYFQFLVGVVISVFAIFHGFRLPGIEKVWVPAVAAFLFFGAGHIVYAKTLQKLEASVFAVFFATHAVWVMCVGVLFLHETLTLWQLVGALLIFASVTLVVKNFRHFSLNQGSALGLLTGLLFGLAISSWSYVGRHTDGLSWAALSFIGSALVSLALRPKILTHLRPLFRPATQSRLLLLSIFYAIGSVAMLFAYQHGSFALVSPLRQTGIMVTVLLALLLLPAERINIPRKLTAALVCSLGVLLLLL